MANVVEGDNMDFDIQEYQELEKEVTHNFLKGLIKLGAVLKKHRDTWKPQKKYMVYLNKIGRNVSSTNQIIRIYEYSITHMTNLLSANITGWDKVNMFLSLPDELKEKLGEGIGGQEVTTEEFREKVSEVRVDDEVVVANVYPIHEQSIEEMIKEAPLNSTDIKFMAKQVLQEMRNTDVGDFSDNCVPIASGFLHVEQAISHWDKEKFESLTRNERVFWKKIVQEQIDRLNNLIK